MSMSKAEQVRRHCQMVPEFCIPTIVECVNDSIASGPDRTAAKVELRGSYVLVAINFLLLDDIYPSEVAASFIPFIAKELCKGVLPEEFAEKETGPSVFMVIEDGLLSIQRGLGPKDKGQVLRRSLKGILYEVDEDKVKPPLRTIAFNLSQGVWFCCNAQPPEPLTQGPPNGSPRSPGQARHPNHPRSASVPG